MWFVQPSQIADSAGNGTGRWRMTARSDEGGGGPFGDTSHDHPSAEEAESCERCDEFTAGVAGFPSRKRQREIDEAKDRRQYARLKAKFETPAKPLELKTAEMSDVEVGRLCVDKGEPSGAL